jgi:hypothetical protein
MELSGLPNMLAAARMQDLLRPDPTADQSGYWIFCIVVGVVALIFLVLIGWDAWVQWKRAAPLRKAAEKNRMRSQTPARPKPLKA